MEGEWFCYKGGLFNGGGMVMLRRWLVSWRENGHVTEITTLMEGEYSCYGGGQFKGRMVMLQRWSVYWRENGQSMEVASLMQGEWSCYGGGQFNGGRIIVTDVASLIRGRMVMLQRWKF